MSVRVLFALICLFFNKVVIVESQTAYQCDTLSAKIDGLAVKINALYTISLRGTQIPDGWTAFKGSLYLFYETVMPYSNAATYCNSLGGHLVHVQNLEENNFIKNQLTRYKDSEWWIGLDDTVTEGRWKLQGTDTNAPYTDWGSTEPNNYQGNEDCAYYHVGYDFKWYDAACFIPKRFICEKNL